MKGMTGAKDTREAKDMNMKNDIRKEDDTHVNKIDERSSQILSLLEKKRMKKILVSCCFLLLAGCLAACAGPVQVARNETEGLKAGYQNPELAALSRKYAGLLKSIYTRYRMNKMSFAKEGLGFTTLTDNSGRKLPYLMVEIRPEDVNFDKNKTTGEQRLQLILQRYFEPNLRVLNKEDVAPDDINGLAFGVSWPVRDFTQCDTAGGFVEYVLAYIGKSDFFSILDGSATVSSVLGNSEVITSLDLAPPKSIKLQYQRDR